MNRKKRLDWKLAQRSGSQSPDEYTWGGLGLGGVAFSVLQGKWR